MTRYLLDTNHMGEAVGRVSVVRDRIQQFHRQGDIFGACIPVLCDLLVGVILCKDAAKTRRRLDRLLEVVRIWPIDLSIAERYAEVYNIDYSRCIFCGYCVEACPTDAITHGHGFEMASFNTSTLIYRKEKLLVQLEPGQTGKLKLDHPVMADSGH